nr:EamA/RhaT family transporter [Propionibacterium sp.]
MQIIPLAIVLQAIGSFCFAMSAYLQHHAVGQETDGNATRKHLDFSTLYYTVKRPRWLLGLLLMGFSLALQVLALTMAPVSVVQPMGILAFPWSIMIAAWAHKKRPSNPILTAVGVTVGATVAFVVISSVFAAPESDLSQTRVFLGALVIYLCAIGLGLAGAKGPFRWRCLFWASGGAFFYGLEAALAKSLIEFARTHAGWASDPAFWSIMVALLLGSATAGWMVQQGYATGPAEIVVASMTITSPVVAFLFGIAVLGEGVNMNAVSGTMMFILGCVAVGGVIRLTQLHPSFEDEIPDEAAAI